MAPKSRPQEWHCVSNAAPELQNSLKRRPKVPKSRPQARPCVPNAAPEPFTFFSGSFRGTVPQAMPASRIKNNALTNIGSYLWSEQRISHSAKKFPFAIHWARLLGAIGGVLGASWDVLGVLGHLGGVSGTIPRKTSIFDRFLLPTLTPET